MEIKTETKMKPKHRARRPKATANPAASLLAALKFVAVAQKKTGTVQQQFGMISGNWAAAMFAVLMFVTASFFSLVEAMIDCYKDFKNNNLKFSKVRHCFEMICFVVFFVGMGYIGVSKFVVDFIK